MVDKVTNSTVEYQVQGNDGTTNVLITGYEVIRFGVPMIGQYVNTGRGRRVTISPAVPGAQYRITAWALGDSRSATPAVVDATIGEASQSVMNNIIIMTWHTVQYCLMSRLTVTLVYICSLINVECIIINIYNKVITSTYIPGLVQQGFVP